MAAVRKTRIRIDTSDVQRWLGRLAALPDRDAILQMEAIWSTLFMQTQAVVHVRTGSLHASGKHSSQHHDKTWRGEITYGGQTDPTSMPHNPVRYAEYERQRGGAHDFIAPLDAAPSAYVQAMLEQIRGADQ